MKDGSVGKPQSTTSSPAWQPAKKTDPAGQAKAKAFRKDVHTRAEIEPLLPDASVSGKGSDTSSALADRKIRKLSGIELLIQRIKLFFAKRKLRGSSPLDQSKLEDIALPVLRSKIARGKYHSAMDTAEELDRLLSVKFNREQSLTDTSDQEEYTLFQKKTVSQMLETLCTMDKQSREYALLIKILYQKSALFCESEYEEFGVLYSEFQVMEASKSSDWKPSTRSNNAVFVIADEDDDDEFVPRSKRGRNNITQVNSAEEVVNAPSSETHNVEVEIEQTDSSSSEPAAPIAEKVTSKPATEEAPVITLSETNNVEVSVEQSGSQSLDQAASLSEQNTRQSVVQEAISLAQSEIDDVKVSDEPTDSPVSVVAVSEPVISDPSTKTTTAKVEETVAEVNQPDPLPEIVPAVEKQVELGDEVVQVAEDLSDLQLNSESETTAVTNTVPEMKPVLQDDTVNQIKENVSVAAAERRVSETSDYQSDLDFEEDGPEVEQPDSRQQTIDRLDSGVEITALQEEVNVSRTELKSEPAPLWLREAMAKAPKEPVLGPFEQINATFSELLKSLPDLPPVSDVHDIHTEYGNALAALNKTVPMSNKSRAAKVQKERNQHAERFAISIIRILAREDFAKLPESYRKKPGTGQVFWWHSTKEDLRRICTEDLRLLKPYTINAVGFHVPVVAELVRKIESHPQLQKYRKK